MGIWEIIGGSLLIIASLAVVISVTMQEQKGNGVNALSGSSDSYIDKNKTMTNEATLSLISKYSGIALFVITLAVLAIDMYIK
ncbi:MAG: preprotein translocase subunit SecG [Oscillospiraceae bacterium]